MQSAIARNLEPPILNPIELEGVLLNRLSSIGQKAYAEILGISETIRRYESEMDMEENLYIGADEDADTY